MSFLKKSIIANVIAGFVIIAGVIAVFTDIENSELLLLLVGAGIGYLFKGVENGVIKK